MLLLGKLKKLNLQQSRQDISLSRPLISSHDAICKRDRKTILREILAREAEAVMVLALAVEDYSDLSLIFYQVTRIDSSCEGVVKKFKVNLISLRDEYRLPEVAFFSSEDKEIWVVPELS
jgi:hypothetical protein